MPRATTSSSCHVTTHAVAALVVADAVAVVLLEHGHAGAVVEVDDEADAAAEVDRLDDRARHVRRRPRSSRPSRVTVIFSGRTEWSPVASEDAAPSARSSKRFDVPTKSATKRRAGPLVELARRAELLDAAVVEHGDAVGEGERLLLVVRHEDEGDAEVALDLLQLDLHLLAELEVERAERLVEQQHLRLDDGGARERDALPLPARELRGLAGGHLLEPHRGERAHGPLVAAPCARCRAPAGRRRRCRARSCAGRARSPGTPCSRRGRTGRAW